MNRYYQMLCVMRSNLSEQEVSQAIQEYSDLVAEYGGTEIEYKNWGKKLLVYPLIKKRQGILMKIYSQKSSQKLAGIYLQIQCQVDSQEIGKILQTIQSNQEVVRCLIVKLKPEKDNFILEEKKRINIIDDIDEKGIISDDDEEEIGFEDVQIPTWSPEERLRIKEDNINYLNNIVDATAALYKLKTVADNMAWESLIEWIAESRCDINFTAATKSVQRLITRTGHKTPYEIAHQLIIHKSLQVAGLELIGDVVETVNNILDGLGSEGIDLPEIAKLSAEMVYQIAQIYGFDIDDAERKQEALYIFTFTCLAEKAITIGIDWLKLGYGSTKLLNVGSKALMIYGIGHLACFYYEYKSQSEFTLIPPDDLVNKLSKERDNYFPDNLSEATVRKQLILEISTAFPAVNYELLSFLLALKKWREADTETESLITELLNRDIKDETSKISCLDIYKIDYLWHHYSQGKFGFQVQKDIYYQSAINKEIGKFGEALGWRGKAFLGIGMFSWKDYDKFIFEMDKSPEGHLPGFWFHKYENHRGFIVKSYLKPILERDDWQNMKNVALSEDVNLTLTPDDVMYNVDPVIFG